MRLWLALTLLLATPATPVLLARPSGLERR